MKVLITEEQVRLLMREFGESVSDRDTWIKGIYNLTSDPRFESSSYEVIAFGEDGEYLGYWDKEQKHGFVVNEYINDDEIDEMVSPESIQDYDAFFGDELKLTDLI